MNRSLAVGCMVLTLGPFAVAEAGVAQASPSGGQCNFVLSPPQVVEVSGVKMVADTVRASSCSMAIEPNLQVVCLTVEGDQSAGQCSSAFAPDQPAVIYYPYRPGATYVATGKGCGQIFSQTDPERCQDLGPTRFKM